MPTFKHRITGEQREWRTDNANIFDRLHNLGWRIVVEDALLQLPENLRALLVSYNTADEVRKASDDELLALGGIGPATLRKIREALQ